MPRTKPASPTTIKDVAALAGVSLMTVSRAIHRPEVVAEATRNKVQSAIEALNYIPDAAAGALSTRKSTTVAVVLPSLHFEGHAKTVDGLSSELRKHGLHLLIADNFYSKTEEMELLHRILGRRPAGIVLINSAHSPAGRDLLLNSGLPVIETWDFPSDPMDAVVGFSHAEVGAALTQHLIDRGHTAISFLSGPPDSDPRGNERLAGFRATMSEHQLDESRVSVVQNDHLSINAGKEGISTLLEEFPDTTAVICLTDRVAMGAMMECRRQNLRVPDDIAITGHGGFDFGEHLVPSLTSTHIDAFGIGERAGRILYKRINNKPLKAADTRIDVGFQVVSRDSTAFVVET